MKQMRNFLVVCFACIIVFSAAGAMAAPPIGGPPEAEPGKLAFTAGYFYSQDKWASNTVLNGEFDPKIETNTYYGQLSYGLFQGWDVYVRAGAISPKLIDSDFRFEPNTSFLAAVGMHGTAFEYKPWSLKFGPMADFTYFSNWTDRYSAGANNISLRMKDHYAFNVGFGFQYTGLSYLTFYGGPFIHYEVAKLETNGTLRGRTISDESNIDSDKKFGSRFGVRVPITPNWRLTFEAQFRDYASGGGWITYAF